MGRDVEHALDETAQLAQRIYPPLLHGRGLAATLRSAAARADIPVRVDVAAPASYPPEALTTVYFCCLEVLEHAGARARATVTVGEEEGALAFEVVVDGTGSATAAEHFGPALDRLRDRLEALGGRLTVRSQPGRGTRVAGSVPLS